MARISRRSSRTAEPPPLAKTARILHLTDASDEILDVLAQALGTTRSNIADALIRSIPVGEAQDRITERLARDDQAREAWSRGSS